MLTLRIDLTDAGCPAAISPQAVSFGQGYVEPFASDQIEMSLRRSVDAAEIWIGEGADPLASPGEAASSPDDYRSHFDREGVKIFVSGANRPPAVSIARTSAGGSPVYVTATAAPSTRPGDSSMPPRTAPAGGRSKEACRLYLEHGDGQVREQVIQDVFMLWPGELLTFDESGLRFEETRKPDIVLPSTLTESARVTEEFLYLVAEAMRPNLAKAREPIVELSGGFDSSCVAIAARSATDRLNSYGLIHEGAMGVQQRRRRRELVDLLEVNDFEFPSYEHPPLGSLEVAEATMTLLDDNHRLPCAYAIDANPVKGLDLILTGVGGDELTKEHTFRRKEWELSGRTFPPPAWSPRRRARTCSCAGGSGPGTR